MGNNHSIPHSYGDNKVVLMCRDPWTLFSYWEIRKDVEDSVMGEIHRAGLAYEKSILRVYDLTGLEPGVMPEASFDFELRNFATSWYIHAPEAGRVWMVDIGIMTTSGKFFLLSRSNVVTAPRDGMSEVHDEEWLCSEEQFYKMFAAAGGYDTGKSSLEIREMVEQHLRKWRFSGGISSGMISSGSLIRRKNNPR